MYPTPTSLSSPNTLSELCTMLCIGGDAYNRSFPYTIIVPTLISLYSSSDTMQDDDIRVLILRSINLILNNVPHCTDDICTNFQLPTHLFGAMLRDIAPSTQLSQIVTNEAFSNRTYASELFEEWVTCVETVALQQAEKIELEAILRLLRDLNGLVRLPLRIQLKILNVLGLVIQRQGNKDSSAKQRHVVGVMTQIIEQLWHLIREEILPTASLSDDASSEDNSPGGGTSGDSERLVAAICDCFAYLIDGFKSDEKVLLQIAEGRAVTTSDTEDRMEITLSTPSSPWSPSPTQSLVSQLIAFLPLQQDRVENQSKILKVLIMLCAASRRIAAHLLTSVNLKILLSCLMGAHGDDTNSALLQMSQTRLIDAFNAEPHVGDSQSEILILLQKAFPNALDSQVYNVDVTPVHAWSWEDDYHNKIPFDALSSKQLETAYAAKKEKILVLRRYEVIFSEMKQYNVQSRLQRSVHRTPLPQSFERTKAHTVALGREPASPAQSPATPSTTDRFDLPPSQCTRSKTKRKIARKSKSPKKGATTTSPSTQKPEPAVQRLTADNDLRVNRMQNDDELVVFIMRNVFPCLMQFSESCTTLTAQQDVAQIISSIFMYCKKDIVVENASLNDVIGFAARQLNGALLDVVIVSHSVYLMKRCLAVFNAHQVQLAFLKHGVDKFAANLVESHTPGTGDANSTPEAVKILKEFYDAHLRNLQHNITEEEHTLEVFCNDLRSGKPIQWQVLTRVFADEQSISDHLYQESKFVDALMEQVFEGTMPHMDRIYQLTQLFVHNRGVLRALIRLTQSQVNSLQDFTDASKMDSKILPGFSSTSDAVAALQDALAFDVVPRGESDVLGEISNATELTFDPMCTIGEVKQFLLGLSSEKDDLSVESFDLYSAHSDTPLSDRTILLQVAHRQSKAKLEDGSAPEYNSLWSNGYVLKYGARNVENSLPISEPPQFTPPLHKSNTLSNHYSSTLSNALNFIRLLHDINQNWHLYQSSSIVMDKSPLVEPAAFQNTFLSSKLRSQMRSPFACMLSVLDLLPRWAQDLGRECSFLFPFSVKQLYYYYQQFGAARALCTTLPVHNQADYATRCVHRTIDRVKIEDRHSIFPEAQRAIQKYAGTRTVLEFEYEGEAGIGLGPTLEFYNLTAAQFQTLDKGMWLSMDDNSAPFVNAPKGLFPCQLPSDAKEQHSVLERFVFLGRFIGKALEDHRLVDLPFSLAFVKLVLGHRLTLSDLRLYEDDVMCQSVEAVCRMRDQKHSIYSNAALQPHERENRLRQLNREIEGTYLTFNFRNVDLIENGADVDLNIENVDKFVEKLTQYLLVDCAKAQIEALHRGLAVVVDVSSLQMFSPEEFLKLLCGEQELWSERTEIESNLQFTGYTLGSKQVQWLVDFMMTLNKDEQKNFLEFTTGATNLPVGGLAALKPKMSIVKSMVRSGRNADDMLPSCNTCFHNLKLPEYSSKEILFAKCRMALTHGRHSFDLT